MYSSMFDPNQMLLSGFRTDPELKWNGLAPMIEKQHGHAAITLDENRVMVIGGYVGQNSVKSVSVYDKRTNECTSDGWPDLNEKRSAHSSVLCNNKVYVFGGYNEDDQSNDVYLSSIECLDLSSSSPQWVTLEQQLSCRRDGCAAVAVGNLIYIIGGYDGKSGLSSMEIFDARTGLILSDQPDMTTVRDGCAAALVGNRIWVVGGESQDRKKLNTIEHLEVNLDTGLPTGQWTTSNACMTTERWYPAVTAVGHCLVIVGGDDNNSNDLTSVEIFDTDRTECFSLPDMGVPRYACATALLGESEVVVMGGYCNGKALCSVESLMLEVIGVRECFELSEERCIQSMSINNVMYFVKWAHLLSANRLLTACFEFVQANKNLLLKDKDFVVTLLEEVPEFWSRLVDNL